MKLVDLKDLQRTLDFRPLKPWPESMPCFALRGELLCGFQRRQGQAIEVQQSLPEIFTQLYPDLKLSELARAWFCLKPLISHQQASELLAFYGFKNSGRAEKFFSQIGELPDAFRDWCDEKKPGINDLSVLFCFEDLSPLTPVLNRIAGDRLSKSDGILALELCGELTLAGKTQDVEKSLAITPASRWLTELKRLRFPVTSEKVASRENRLSQIPWPKGIHAQLVRQGDRDFVELKFRACNASDFNRQLEALSSLANRQAGDWL